MLFGVGFVALIAAESLEAVAVASKMLARGFAGMAGHGFSPLALSGEKSHTVYGSRAWVTPRFGFCPATC
jgi:hypothetical protein